MLDAKTNERSYPYDLLPNGVLSRWFTQIVIKYSFDYFRLCTLTQPWHFDEITTRDKRMPMEVTPYQSIMTGQMIGYRSSSTIA